LVCCGQTVGWIKMKLGVEVGLSPGHIVLDGVPAPPPQKRCNSPLNFRPMSIVAKRLPISATAEHLLEMVSTKSFGELRFRMDAVMRMKMWE